jgi:ubiquinone/menaquinone biosynthesis C-methylase UbiE
MKHVTDHIEKHYGRGKILDSILNALKTSGKELSRLKPADLAAVDEFHIRGRRATVELANLADFVPGCRVLNVGCGLGGSARYLAVEYRCRVTGIDLTQEYVNVANTLSDLVGLSERAEFLQGDALNLPFEEDSFDLVWTEHAQMNIAYKHQFYGEIARVLRPGGQFIFHDIFGGKKGAFHYPVPWADDESINFLITPNELKEILEKSDLIIGDWMDKSRESLDWFVETKKKLQESGPPPLGFHLLIGDNAAVKFENQIKNLRENKFVVLQASAKKLI